jgi:VCBS repeat-containing protein
VAVGTSQLVPGIGTITIYADGSYNFTPLLNYNGPVPLITYTMSDGQGGTDTSTLTINVTPVNDAPVDGDEIVSLVEDTPLNVPAGSGLLANTTDVDGGTPSIQDFSIASETGPFVVGTPYLIPSVGTITINSDGSYSFAPVADFNGAVPLITYTVSDGNGGTDSSTLTLTVTPVNDPPVATDESFTTAEDTALVVPVMGVLGNDTDVDGDLLSAILVTGPVNGTLTINPDGSFSYLPNANFNGVDTFTYMANDGTADSNIVTVTINVTPENDAPVADDQTVTTPMDVPISGIVTATDVDGDSLTFSGPIGGPSNGGVAVNPDGTFTYTPVFGFFGTDTFDVLVDDSNGGTTIATVTVVVTQTATAMPEPTVQPPLTTDSQLEAWSSMVIDGIILETVNDIGSLVTFREFGEHDIIVDVANDIDRLETLPGRVGLATGHPVERTVDFMRYIDLSSSKFANASHDWDTRPLMGFSVRLPIDGASDRSALPFANQIVVDTLLRENVLLIEISNTVDHEGEQRIVGYSAVQVDGRPLPAWIERPVTGVLLGKVPSDGEDLELKITAHRADGTSVTRAITIQLGTGDVQESEPASRPNVPLFEDQLRSRRAN